jgi:hypothetical protein
MSNWTKFATKFYQQQKKKNPDYKFSQALKDGAKVYKKRGGGEPKIVGGEGDEVIKDKNTAIAAIVKCTTEEELEAVALRIVDDSLNSDTDVKAAVEKKMEDIKNAIGSSKVINITTESEAKNPAPEIGSSEDEDITTESDEVEDITTESEATNPAPEIGSSELVNAPKTGGKKAKKSAKKGKKSAKKGGKKARKSAKKSRR